MSKSELEFDCIIVGGGTAGSVLASRLSERSSKTVLLCEAGQDIRDDDAPPEILDSFAARAFLDSRFLWNDLTVTTEVISHNDPGRRPRERKYEQARVLGGGSAINGQLANRGLPADYDEWAERGAIGWHWDAVLPYFRKLERDIDFGGPLHGDSGPMPIRRIFPGMWAAHALAMAEAFKALGYEYLEDQNADFRDGYHPFPISNLYDRRVPTSIAYLTPTVRLRKNLTILTDTQVTELVFEGEGCVGIRALVKGQTAEFRGREIILSGGAIYSPALLLRAGIGPAVHLREIGIPIRKVLPGVGQRLMDHPAISLASFTKPFARLNGKTRRHLLVGLRYSSFLPGMPANDMAISVSTKSAWHAVGDQISSFTMWVNKTISEAGEVRLRSADWRDPPQVDFNLLYDRRDLDRLMASFKRFARLFELPVMKAVVSDPFAASYSERVKAVGRVNRRNALQTQVLAYFLDGPAFLRRFLLQKVIAESPPLHALLNDDVMLEQFIRRTAVSVWHASCSCRMGAESDPMAVVDPQGRVYGVGGLRVADSSIFPVIPRANINLPTIMVAEKIAAKMNES